MKHPMTKRGAELLRTELHRLKTVERPAATATFPKTPSTKPRATARA